MGRPFGTIVEDFKQLVKIDQWRESIPALFRSPSRAFSRKPKRAAGDAGIVGAPAEL